MCVASLISEVLLNSNVIIYCYLNENFSAHYLTLLKSFDSGENKKKF